MPTAARAMLPSNRIRRPDRGVLALTSRYRMHPALADTSHRPWPRPAGPWIMAQTWHDLLFAHWPLEPSGLRERLPPGLALDTFDGRAWLGVVPFRMTGVRPRFAPPVPGLSGFPELNVRTYVRAGSKPGVLFFSLDAGSAVAVAVARRLFHLPYFRAEMELRRNGEAVEYHSSRTHPGAPPAELHGRYAPLGPVFRAAPDSLEHFLTERYCLYTTPRSAPGRLLRGEIHHAPWPLQAAEAELSHETCARAAGLERGDEPPHVLFARRLDVVVWRLREVNADGT